MFFKKRFSPAKLPDGFTVTGHTGCMGTPANSLASITAAHDCGAQIVEFDLRFDKNGEPVLSHDEPTGNEFSLDEAFAKVSRFEGLQVNVDVKTTSHLEKVVPLAEKHGILERMFFTGITEDDVAAVREKCPGVPYYLNHPVANNQDKEYLVSLVNKVRDCGAVGINFHHSNLSEALIDAFRRNGLLVSVWTVNRSHDMRRVLSLGPDNITTKEPYKLRGLLPK